MASARAEDKGKGNGVTRSLGIRDGLREVLVDNRNHCIHRDTVCLEDNLQTDRVAQTWQDMAVAEAVPQVAADRIANLHRVV